MRSLLNKLPVTAFNAPINFSSCMGIKNPSEEIVVADKPPPAIIPLAQNAECSENMHLIQQENIICFDEESAKAGNWLQELLERPGTETNTIEGSSCGNWIFIKYSGLEEQLGSQRNFSFFTSRLLNHGERLNEMGILFLPSAKVNLTSIETRPEETTTVFSGFLPVEN